MPQNARFNICDECFSKRNFSRRPPRSVDSSSRDGRDRDRGGSRNDKGGRGGSNKDNRNKKHTNRSENAPAPSKASKPLDQGIRPPKPPTKKNSGGKSGDAAKAFRKFR